MFKVCIYPFSCNVCISHACMTKVTAKVDILYESCKKTCTKL